MLQNYQLSCVEKHFKYRILNSHSIAFTDFSNLSQSFLSGSIRCIYIAGHDQHALLPYLHFLSRSAHLSAAPLASGKIRHVKAVKEESAPSHHPWQNQSSSSGSSSQITGEKASDLNPICTPCGTLSSRTAAS